MRARIGRHQTTDHGEQVIGVRFGQVFGIVVGPDLLECGNQDLIARRIEVRFSNHAFRRRHQERHRNRVKAACLRQRCFWYS